MSTTTPEAAPKKPIWTRCKGSGKGEGNGCGQRIYNDRIDIELHRQHCPADLERDVAALARRITDLEKAEPATPELPNLDDVAEWPGADDESAPAYSDSEDAYDPPISAAAHVNATVTHDGGEPYDEDDDFDDEPTAAPLGASLYSPTTGPLT